MDKVIDLIVEVQRTGQSGSLKKKWVLQHLPPTVDPAEADMVIDKIISILACQTTMKLMNVSSKCTRWCCRGK
jgi:peroxiredoxin family protein